jgi:hypothetical protein
MTAVATILTNDSQVIISDLLLSASPKGTTPETYFLPTGVVQASILPNNHPLSLCQKTIIINPFLVFCWAGKEIFAYTACKHLREQYEDVLDFSPALARKIIIELLKIWTPNNDFLVSFFDRSDGSVHTFQQGGSKTTHNGDDEIYFFGSGGFQVYEMDEPSRREYNDNTLARAMSIVSHMIDQEKMRNFSSIAATGGAWEITHRSKDGFKKLDPVVYSQWVLFPNEDSYTFRLDYVLGSKYFGDRLSIKSLIRQANGPSFIAYGDAWVPGHAPNECDLFEPKQFTLNSPNQVISVRIQYKFDEYKIFSYAFIDCSEDDLPFREFPSLVKRNTHDKISYDLDMLILDRAYDLFKKSQI